MKKVIVGGKRPGSGRKPTGKDPVRTMRFSDEFISTVDGWAAEQDDAPGRSEAIRRLVEIGLSRSKAASKRTKMLSITKQSAARAAELAGHAIDARSDQNASDDERKVRKRKLIEGPSVFRHTRKDWPGT